MVKEPMKGDNSNDELYTPEYAIYPLLEYLPKTAVIWECTSDGHTIAEGLKKRGYEVIETHLDNGFNFLTDEPDFDYDIQVTNPPFSKKNEFLKRSYEIGKPFAMLLPITTLESISRGKMFREKGIQVLVLDRRVEFMSKSVWFNTSWFCWNLLPQDLIFAELDKTGGSN